MWKITHYADGSTRTEIPGLQLSFHNTTELPYQNEKHPLNMWFTFLFFFYLGHMWAIESETPVVKPGCTHFRFTLV